MDLNEALKHFYHFSFFEKGLSESSVKAYLSDLKQFFDFFKQKALNKITLEDFYFFLSFCKKQNISTNSISRKITSIKSFYFFLESEKIIENSFVEKIDTPKKKSYFPDVLTQKEINLILKKIKKETHQQYRDFFMIKILYALGLRVSELSFLKISDFNLNEGYVKIKGKGDKVRILPLYDQLVLEIEDYLFKTRSFFDKKKNVQYFFLNRLGQKISRVSVWKILSKTLKGFSFKKKITPHTFRHTFATHLIQNGSDMRSVQELLGHSDIKTTEIYTHLVLKDLQEAIKKHHPLYTLT